MDYLSDLKAKGWNHIASGKVRELFEPGSELQQRMREEYGQDVVLVVATDRISAFDYILGSEIPGKGEVLTQMSLLWFQALGGICPNHLLSAVDNVPEAVLGRGMICKKLDMFPVECVARGYLTGSAFLEYSETGSYQDADLPAGLEDGTKLSTPIFTPAMKAEVGEHDENVTYSKVAEAIGEENASKLRALTLKLFAAAEQIARKAGLTLVDTKFEFGVDPKTGVITLGDEVLTPDSSRYWNEDRDSYDKQFVRNYLKNDSGWSPASGDRPPALPDDVIEKTAALYQEALKKLQAATL